MPTFILDGVLTAQWSSCRRDIAIPVSSVLSVITSCLRGMRHSLKVHDKGTPL